MSKQTSELVAEHRSEVRKGASRRLRHQGYVPAVVYGAGKEATAIKLSHNKLMHALENEAIYSKILTLDLDGKKEPVILKDLQRHPYKKQIVHLDLLRIREDQKLEVRVPLHFIGIEIAPGIKLGGGIPIYFQKEVEVSCLPKDLPEFIEVDISKLELNQRLFLADIKLPSSVALAVDTTIPEHNLPIVTIQLVEEEVEVEEKPVETIITTAKVEGEAGAAPTEEGAAKAKEEKGGAEAKKGSAPEAKKGAPEAKKAAPETKKK